MRALVTPTSIAHGLRFLLVGVALGVAVLLVQTTPADAQEEDGAMAVDCEGNTLELDVECQFGEGQEFTVGVQVISPPDGGYSAFQTNLRWDSDVLSYRPSDPPGSEAVWERCTIPVRNNDSLETVLFGCVPFPIDSIDPETYEDVGTVLLFTFACAGQGTSEVALVPREGASVLDTYFLIPPGAITDPTLAAASVTCGGAAVARPTPEITPGVSALGPAGDTVPPDEQVSSADAAATLVLNPDLGRPQGEAAGDDDGGAWVWIVITVGALIAVSALGLIFGRRRRSES